MTYRTTFGKVVAPCALLLSYTYNWVGLWVGRCALSELDDPKEKIKEVLGNNACVPDVIVVDEVSN